MAKKVSKVGLDIEEDIGVSIGVCIGVHVVVGIRVVVGVYDGIGGELRSWGMWDEMVKTGEWLIGLWVGYTPKGVKVDGTGGIGGWR